MEIILLSRKRGSLLRLRCGRFMLAIAGLALTTLCGSLALAGYDAGASRAAKRILDASDEVGRAEWQRTLLDSRRSIVQVRASAERDLNALSLRVGTLQAHVARLDALGQRLATMAGLPGGEFDFAIAPALGGPAPADAGQSSPDDVLEGLRRLGQELSDREDKLQAIEALLMDRKLEASVRPDGKPLAGGWMSSGFGSRSDPVNGRREFHRGVDFTGRAGSEILAVADGVVTWEGRRPDYGYSIEITHGDGYVTSYSHNKENLVRVGDKVARGQMIGRMGATGRTTGAHVHFEVLRDGRPVNPLPYITAANAGVGAPTRR